MSSTCNKNLSPSVYPSAEFSEPIIKMVAFPLPHSFLNSRDAAGIGCVVPGDLCRSECGSFVLQETACARQARVC